MSTLDIVGICGSLRKASLNHAALRLAGDSLPAGMALDTVDWREVPVFDGDVLRMACRRPWPRCASASAAPTAC